MMVQRPKPTQRAWVWIFFLVLFIWMGFVSYHGYRPQDAPYCPPDPRECD